MQYVAIIYGKRVVKDTADIQDAKPNRRGRGIKHPHGPEVECENLYCQVDRLANFLATTWHFPIYEATQAAEMLYLRRIHTGYYRTHHPNRIIWTIFKLIASTKMLLLIALGIIVWGGQKVWGLFGVVRSDAESSVDWSKGQGNTEAGETETS